MAELLRRTLHEDGHQVVLARDGREGFEMARCSPFDVIVLDVMLPGMDGTTLARRLRACRNQTPILMLTARDATTDVVQGLDSGADDYLTKPFSIDVLLARLRSVSRRGAIPRTVSLEIADLKGDQHRNYDWRGLAVTIFRRARPSGYELSCNAQDAAAVFDRKSASLNPIASNPSRSIAIDASSVTCG